jgi:septum site-determining protein MinC
MAAAEPAAPAPQLVIGPIRSGIVLESLGHVIVLGDVNPGAEIRAIGSVIVMGALRGVAHAGCQGGPGVIIALRLAPQQLRVGELIARAGDGGQARGAEIAYAADGRIIVEDYQGKLPGGARAAGF